MAIYAQVIVFLCFPTLPAHVWNLVTVANAFEVFFMEHLSGDRKTVDSDMPSGELLDWLESRLNLFYEQLKGEVARNVFLRSFQVLMAMKKYLHAKLQATKSEKEIAWTFENFK
jgi:hypothetical protein